MSVVTDGMGLNMTVMSYCGKLDFGIVSDRDQMPDLWSMIDWLGEELDALKPKRRRRSKQKAKDQSGAGADRLISLAIGRMRFGIFYEHQNPRPWEGERSEHELLRDALDQVELADRLGFDYVWEVEHHFLEEYSHSSAPEVFLAAASQRTERIRLGHGIVQIPPAVNHPARVAERVATLDLVSDGRVDFGSGESSSRRRARRLPGRPRGQARDVGGRDRRDHADVRRGAVRRLGQRVHPDAAAQRRPEAAPEPAPAALGRLQPPRDDPLRRRATASARCRSPSSSPRTPATGCASTTS